MKNDVIYTYDFDNIIGNSKQIINVKNDAIRATKTSSPVLIYGETGTGKELFVQAIHNNSDRRHKPFIPQNCAAIPYELFESILFGISEGSFTGAKSRTGLFEMADGGTLYLDELNSIPKELQAKLLRTIQEGAIMKIGDTKHKKIDVRIIASLNEEPEQLIRDGRLRSDLFYRLNVVRINVPALRQRKEDIPMLVDSFIQKFNYKFNSNIEGIEEDVLEQMLTFKWEGNVRELEHSIEAAFNRKSEGMLSKEDFLIFKEDNNVKNQSLKYKLNEYEKDCIKEALIICNDNISRTAKYLDIPRQTLQYKIKKHNLIKSKVQFKDIDS